MTQGKNGQSRVQRRAGTKVEPRRKARALTSGRRHSRKVKAAEG